MCITCWYIHQYFRYFQIYPNSLMLSNIVSITQHKCTSGWFESIIHTKHYFKSLWNVPVSPFFLILFYISASHKTYRDHHTKEIVKHFQWLPVHLHIFTKNASISHLSSFTIQHTTSYLAFSVTHKQSHFNLVK